MTFLNCSKCGKQVSSPVPKGIQVRAVIQCRKCSENNCHIQAIHRLIQAIRGAAIEADWCSTELADAIIFGESCLPEHLKRG